MILDRGLMPDTRRKIILVAISCVIVLFAGSKLMDFLKSDETRIQEFFDDISTYAVSRDVGGLKDYLDPEYKDANGYTYTDAVNAIRYFCQRFNLKKIEFVILGTPIIDGDSAIVNVRAVCDFKSPSGSTTLRKLGFKHDLFEVKLKRFDSYYRTFSVTNTRPPVGSKEGEAQVE